MSPSAVIIVSAALALCLPGAWAWSRGERPPLRHPHRSASPRAQPLALAHPECDGEDLDDELCLAFGSELAKRITSGFHAEVLRRQSEEDGAGVDLRYLHEGPSPLLPPTTVVQRVLMALMQNDYPQPGNGEQQAFRFTTPEPRCERGAAWVARPGTRGEIIHEVEDLSQRVAWTAGADAGTSLEAFREMLRSRFTPLYSMTDFEFAGAPRFSSNDRECACTIIAQLEGGRSAELVFQLQRHGGEDTRGGPQPHPHKDCWLIAGLSFFPSTSDKW